MDAKPRDITSYDLLKSLAVTGMLVDHFGYYFFPDQPWIQAVARIVGPTWFFLIGYSRSRALPWPMWAGTAVLALASLLSGLGVFPLSALMTMLLVRMTVGPLAARMLRSWPFFWGFMALLALLIVPTAAFLEYGTVGLMVGMLGYIARNDATVQTAKRRNTTLLACWAATVAIGTATQELVLGFSALPFLVMAAGQAATLALLCRFGLAEHRILAVAAPRPVAAALRFGGRHTLEIYVFHLLLFKALACILEPQRFHFLHLQLFYHP